jgi:hypothetical protein
MASLRQNRISAPHTVFKRLAIRRSPLLRQSAGRLAQAVGEQETGGLHNPEQKNYEAVERLEGLLREVRANRHEAREAEAIREIGLEIAIAVREVGAMLINVGRAQTYASNRPSATHDPDRTP